VTCDATPLQLTALRSLDMSFPPLDYGNVLRMSQLSSCTQLRWLTLRNHCLVGPDSLVASTMLQELHLYDCRLSNPDSPACADPWQLLFPGPGRLPHLTSAVLCSVDPAPRQADLERLVACCSGLRVLTLRSSPSSRRLARASAFECLSHLTNLATLHLTTVTDQHCSSLAQLTGLKQLVVDNPKKFSPVGLRHLACLQQLTSLGFMEAFDSYKVKAVLQAQLSDRFETLSQGCNHTLVNKVRAAADCKAAFAVSHDRALCVPATLHSVFVIINGWCWSPLVQLDCAAVIHLAVYCSCADLFQQFMGWCSAGGKGMGPLEYSVVRVLFTQQDFKPCLLANPMHCAGMSSMDSCTCWQFGCWSQSIDGCIMMA